MVTALRLIVSYCVVCDKSFEQVEGAGNLTCCKGCEAYGKECKIILPCCGCGKNRIEGEPFCSDECFTKTMDEIMAKEESREDLTREYDEIDEIDLPMIESDEREVLRHKCNKVMALVGR